MKPRVPLLFVLAACFCGPVAPRYQDAMARSVFIFDRAAPSASASGFFLDSSGTVISCRHIFSNPSFSPELRRDGKTYPLRTIAESASFDLVMLKAEGTFDVAGNLQIKPQSELRIAERVFLFGAPFGLAGSYLEGYISNASVPGVNPDFPQIRYIQISGLAYPGTSGAAVYAENGSLVGIQEAAYGLAPNTGIGMLISSDMLDAFLKNASYSLP